MRIIPGLWRGVSVGGNLRGAQRLLDTIVRHGGPANQPPVVDAGADGNVTLPSMYNLVGSATDDGLLVPLTYLWTQRTGPGTVTFGDAADPTTTASFSMAGTYVLRLTADDGALTAWDEITITVAPNPIILHDAFTDSNGTALNLHTIAPIRPGSAVWGEVSNLEISSNLASPTLASAAAVTDCGVSTHTTRVSVVNDGSDRWGILTRYVTIVPGVSGSYFFVSVQPGYLEILEYDGVSSTLTQRAYLAITISASRKVLRGTWSGNLLTADYDGGADISYTGSAGSSSTKVGLFAVIGGTFEDFQVEV